MSEFYWCVEYLATFIEIFFCCYFCGTFITKQENKNIRKNVVLSIIVSVMIILLNKLELFSYLTTLMFILLCIIIQWIIHKTRYFQLIALVLVYAVVLSIVDFFVIYLVAIIMNTNTGYLTGEHSSIRIVCILLSKCILILLAVTLNRVVARNITIPTRYIIITSVCSGFLLISNFVLVHSELGKAEEEISSFYAIFFVASLGIEMIIFSFVIKIAEGYEQKKIASLVELNNIMLKKSLVETENMFYLWRKSIHDYKYHIMCLSQLAEEEKLEEIKAYLSLENETMVKKNSLFKTGNTMVDAIINTKKNVAEEMGIMFVVNATMPGKISIHEMDLASILGNLIDNAIEAEQKEEEPSIQITIKQEKMFFVINVSNKCTILTDSELKTTKKQAEFHGIGLQSVRRTVEQYGGEVRIKKEQDEFLVTVFIQNKYE